MNVLLRLKHISHILQFTSLFTVLLSQVKSYLLCETAYKQIIRVYRHMGNRSGLLLFQITLYHSLRNTLSEGQSVHTQLHEAENVHELRT